MSGIFRHRHRAGSHQCAPYDDSPSGTTYIVVLAIIVYFMSSVMMLYCYCKVYIMTHSHVQRRRVGDAANPIRRQQSLSSFESHILHTLILMVVALFICWVPSVMSYFPIIVSPPTIDTIFSLCVFGNSAVNPLFYALRQKNFQRGFETACEACLPVS